MTFSNASMSARDVDVVAATAAGAVVLRAGVGEVTRWRAGGAGAASGGGKVAVLLTSLAGAVAACGGAVFGTTLRAIGRALGSGTPDLASDLAADLASVLCWDFFSVLGRPSTASTGKARPVTTADANAADKTVDNAVDRNAVAREIRVTAVFRGESVDR
jgi:hypothetical protein